MPCLNLNYTAHVHCKKTTHPRRNAALTRIQGHLGHRATSLIRDHPPLGTPKDPRHSPTVGSKWGAVFYERDTPVRDPKTYEPALDVKPAHSRWITRMLTQFRVKSTPRRCFQRTGNHPGSTKGVCMVRVYRYRGTALIRHAHHPRTTIGPEAYPYCRVLGGGGF